MCFGSRTKEGGDNVARSRELDKIIRQDEKRLSKEVKLLLLGKLPLSANAMRPQWATRVL